MGMIQFITAEKIGKTVGAIETATVSLGQPA